jgi:hypothetical protein
MLTPCSSIIAKMPLPLKTPLCALLPRGSASALLFWAVTDLFAE